MPEVVTLFNIHIPCSNGQAATLLGLLKARGNDGAGWFYETGLGFVYVHGQATIQSVAAGQPWETAAVIAERQKQAGMHQPVTFLFAGIGEIAWRYLPLRNSAESAT